MMNRLLIVTLDIESVKADSIGGSVINCERHLGPGSSLECQECHAGMQ